MTRKETFQHIAIILTLLAGFFITGYNAGLDIIMDKQIQAKKLSVYCQQLGAIEMLCNKKEK